MSCMLLKTRTTATFRYRISRKRYVCVYECVWMCVCVCVSPCLFVYGRELCGVGRSVCVLTHVIAHVQELFYPRTIITYIYNIRRVLFGRRDRGGAASISAFKSIFSYSHKSTSPLSSSTSIRFASFLFRHHCWANTSAVRQIHTRSPDSLAHVTRPYNARTDTTRRFRFDKKSSIQVRA